MAKTSSAASSPAENVVKTTTIREVLAPGETGQPKTTEFLEFVRSIPDEKLGDYTIYLYRMAPGRVQIDHTPGRTFDVPGYGIVSAMDMEGLETVITQDCGGGDFWICCNKRSSGELQAQKKFHIDMPAKSFVPWHIRRGEGNKVESGKNMQQYNPDGTVVIATKAMDAAAEQRQEFVQVGLSMFREGAAALRESRQPAPVDPMLKALQDDAIKRVLAPPPDPVDQLTRTLALVAQLRGNDGNGNGGTFQNLSGLRDLVSFARELAGSTQPAVSAGAEIVRVVANGIPQVVEGIRAWQLGKEAERDTAAIIHANPQPRPTVMPPPQLPAHNFPSVNPTKIPPPVSTAAPAPAPQPPMNAQPDGAPSLEFLEQRIVEILRKPISAETAAEQVLDFLDDLSGENPPPDRDYAGVLSAQGEPGLVQLFQTRPNLRPALNNTGRLLDFIRAFLRLHAEDLAEQERQRKPN